MQKVNSVGRDWQPKPACCTLLFELTTLSSPLPPLYLHFLLHNLLPPHSLYLLSLSLSLSLSLTPCMRTQGTHHVAHELPSSSPAAASYRVRALELVHMQLVYNYTACWRIIQVASCVLEKLRVTSCVKLLQANRIVVYSSHHVV